MGVESTRFRPLQTRICSLLLVVLIAPTAIAQESEHIFEPGKKHVCVPAASGEGWDCGTDEQPPAAAPHRDGPALRTSRANDPASASLADAAAAEAEPVATPSSPAPRDTKPPSRDVPSYLLASPSSVPDDEPTVAAAAPASAAAPAPEVSSPPAVAPPAIESRAREATLPSAAPASSVAAPAVTSTAPTTPVSSPSVATNPDQARDRTAPAVANATDDTTIQSRENSATSDAAHAPAAAAPPERTSDIAATPPTPAQAAPAQAAPADATARSGATPVDESQQRAAFGALRGSAYVLELARGADRDRVAAAASVALPEGRVWLLRLSREGSDWYVALWGEFPTVEAARDARNVAAAQGVTEVGWPRRIGPLQQELRLQR
ncbi:MAG: hypothetical protein ABI411_01115 [Tahibacter sp.]